MRALLIIVDGLGAGPTADAARFGDQSADTLRHVLRAKPALQLPTLWSLGLGHILRQNPAPFPTAAYGTLSPTSLARDTSIAHWELAGALLDEPRPAAPPATVLDALSAAGVPILTVGPTADFFAHVRISHAYPTTTDTDTLRTLSEIWPAVHHGLVWVHLTDLDKLYGHTRDPQGFARALESLDRHLGEFIASAVRRDDLFILTSSHGNDPTSPGHAHTREQVPLLLRYAGINHNLGMRCTFADLSATLATCFALDDWLTGNSFIDPDLFPPAPVTAPPPATPRRRIRPGHDAQSSPPKRQTLPRPRKLASR